MWFPKRRLIPNILIALWFILLSALCFHCPWSIACYICGERVLWNFYYFLWDQTCPQECIPESQTTRSRNLTVMVCMVLTQLTPGDTPRPRWGAAAALCWHSPEEIPYVQCKRNPNKMVGVARGIRRQTHWNHNHRKLVNLITLGPQPCLTQWN